MNAPTLWRARPVAEDTEALSTHLELPGFGVLPVNAFLVRAAEPVLVDTGIPALADDFIAALRDAIALEELRWIWLTHADLDHAGALARILELAPRARVVTTFLGMGKVNMSRPILGPDRVHLLRPGQRLDVGDRELLACRPPTFDAPETTALVDLRTRALFSADSFGALLPRAALDVDEVPAAALREGAIAWATIDNPWIHTTDERALDEALDAVAGLAPSRILGSHLPPASPDALPVLAEHVRRARQAPPFAGPDQSDLMKMAGAQAA